MYTPWTLPISGNRFVVYYSILLLRIPIHNLHFFQKNLTYQDNLSSQVAHGGKIRQAEQAEKQRELHIQNLAEEQYQTKFGESLQRPDVDRAHPLRSYNKRSNPLFN